MVVICSFHFSSLSAKTLYAPTKQKYGFSNLQKRLARRAAHKMLDRLLDLARAHRGGLKGRDRGFDRARRYVERVIAIAARVQDLEADLPACAVNRLSHDAVSPRLSARREAHPKRLKPPSDIG